MSVVPIKSGLDAKQKLPKFEPKIVNAQGDQNAKHKCERRIGDDKAVLNEKLKCKRPKSVTGPLIGSAGTKKPKIGIGRILSALDVLLGNEKEQGVYAILRPLTYETRSMVTVSGLVNEEPLLSGWIR